MHCGRGLLSKLGLFRPFSLPQTLSTRRPYRRLWPISVRVCRKSDVRSKKYPGASVQRCQASCSKTAELASSINLFLAWRSSKPTTSGFVHGTSDRCTETIPACLCAVLRIYTQHISTLSHIGMSKILTKIPSRVSLLGRRGADFSGLHRSFAGGDRDPTELMLRWSEPRAAECHKSYPGDEYDGTHLQLYRAVRT
ncbi:hypothetical protein AURDEDRAFT_146329 [Auricularia subglabra TFB-10046 SS5]|nr:hypothetical protein AURDEDRAFT_146329 [Auricularia subglabra TFB-10046 SS5]